MLLKSFHSFISSSYETCLELKFTIIPANAPAAKLATRLPPGSASYSISSTGSTVAIRVHRGEYVASRRRSLVSATSWAEFKLSVGILSDGEFGAVGMKQKKLRLCKGLGYKETDRSGEECPCTFKEEGKIVTVFR